MSFLLYAGSKRSRNNWASVMKSWLWVIDNRIQDDIFQENVDVDEALVIHMMIEDTGPLVHESRSSKRLLYTSKHTKMNYKMMKLRLNGIWQRFWRRFRQWLRRGFRWRFRRIEHCMITLEYTYMILLMFILWFFISLLLYRIYLYDYTYIYYIITLKFIL